MVANLCCVTGCGEGDDEPGDGLIDAALADGGAPEGGTVQPMSGPLLPWKQGYSWTYRVTGDGAQTTKVTTVGALEPVAGSGPNAAKMANKVVTKKGSVDETVSWQGVEGERVVRYREQSFGAMSKQLQLEEHWAPAKLHVDWSAAHIAAGASWIEEYMETKAPVGQPAETKTTRDVWKVDAINQMVTVPAGTFTNAIILTKSGGSSQKTYWYVPGVGKVKETGGQAEELVSYKVDP
jgi:hypothetical protein